MRHYETTCVLRPNLGEAVFTEIIERITGIITGEFDVDAAVAEVQKAAEDYAAGLSE